MPKILRKNIFRASIGTAISGLVVLVIFVGSILKHGNIIVAFNIINLFLLIAELPNDKPSLLRFELPDYMYIAPYSREQREVLIRRGIKYRFMAIYITLLLIIIAPVFIYSVLNRNVMCSIFCIAEAILLFTTLYSRIHLRYLLKVSVLSYVVIEITAFFQYVIFEAITNYSNHSGESNDLFEVIRLHKADIFLLGCLMLAGIIITLVCRVKYFKSMICYQADYENIREVK